MADIISAGSIDERGYVFGMDRKGFNGNRSLSEIIGNCLDAKATEINVITRESDVLITDNGKGMDVENHQGLWDAQKENHKGEETTGVSGFGAKPATKVLSQNKEVTFYSKKDGCEYCKSYAPWHEIISKGQYTGMVNISVMDDEEKKEFRELLGEGTGTIIKFPKSSFLKDVITTQFMNPKMIPESNQRLDCIYSKFIHCSIYFTDIEEGIKKKKLEMYNYFGAPDHDYYQTMKTTIHIFKDSKNDIVFARLNGTTYDCYEYTGEGRGKGYRIKPFSPRAALQVGTLVIDSSMRKDNKWFDPNGFIVPGAAAGLHSYDEGFFTHDSENVKADLFYPHIMRNDQYIGNLYPLPRLKASNGRANGLSCLNNCLIRTEISYVTCSDQDNIMDETIGIQENKNQLNTHQISETLKRLVEDNITDLGKEIWKTLNSKVSTNEQDKRTNDAKIIAEALAQAKAIEAQRIAAASEEEEEEEENEEEEEERMREKQKQKMKK